MPANKKYLTQSPFQKFLKITAGFIGGYTVMITLMGSFIAPCLPGKERLENLDVLYPADSNICHPFSFKTVT
jgi:hypothetical protein